jgi:hypothetical protein
MAITRRLFVLLAALTALAVMPAGALAAAPPAVVGAIGNNTTLSGATSVAVAGDVAYTTAYWTGELTAVDISNPSSPAVLGSTAPNVNLENGTDVTTAGHYAFVTSKNRNLSPSSNDDTSGNSLTIVDISNPATPTILGTVQDPARLFGAYGVAVSGNYAYVAYQGLLSGQPTSPDTSTGGFTVIDITNAGGPTIVANVNNNSLSGAKRNSLEHATSVALSGHYAYVTGFYDSRLTVIDISNPTAVTASSIVNSLRDPTNLPFPNNVAIQGSYAYVANQVGAAGVQLAVVSLANPASPVVVGSLGNAILGGSYTVRVSGSIAYLAANGTSTIAAVDISNPTSPRLVWYVQDAGHLNAATGLDVDSTGAYVIGASPRLSTDPKQTYPPFVNTTGTVSVVALDPVPIGVTIAPSSEPPNPTNQTTASFSFSVSDDISTVACKLDGAPFGPCTTNASAQYSSLANGTHTFTVQATDAAGHTASASYTWTIGSGSPAPPRNTALPTISGTAVQHAQLTGGLGSWTGNPAPSLSAQWLRCNSSASACRAIAGATGASYTVTSADVGSRIRLKVRATNTSGSSQAGSAATAVVKANPAASLTGVARRHANLNLTGVRVVSALNEIDIAVPRGLRFVTRSRKLIAGIRITDQRGRQVGFTAALRHGTLVLTLKRSVQTAHVTIGPRALTVSAKLASSVKHKRIHRLTLTVAFGLAGGPRFHTALRVPVR